MLRALPRLLATLAASAVLAFAAPVPARELARYQPGGPVDLAVVDRDSGQWLSTTVHRGQRWIAGTPGHRYSVRLANTSGRRVLVVLSVDGVNAVSGQTAHPSQTGYVLAPWQTMEVEGWRKSLDQVAQFVFTDLPDSYAARTGRPDNVGVIGVAVFEEAGAALEDRPRGEVLDRIERGDAAKSAAPAARESDAAAQSIGTGHGQREWSPASHTQFIRATRAPTQVSELRYDDYDTLVARGVLRPYPRYLPDSRPRAFPGGFVADPPRYTGE
ncbi:hypothetical protein MNR01_13855 [Lysobacter sp. S4-A87]|uniref:hypothetical protein n=1 Tax=Lysobacter sp. S4-A87 TaxID=2925843 RepID=UPI001F52BF51|nr:hypothetical protein [Lysobacter sp. S4-A87]UNK48815.1 hypothetical protein MNR01_13855 [Lysobacter sp. S4-A87]